MNLAEIFINSNYLDITSIESAEQHSLNVGFLYDLTENGEYQKPQNLLYIFLSQYGDELFLVLDGTGEDLCEFCSNWDRKLLKFCNFGSQNTEILRSFTYNMVQIILLSNSVYVDNENNVEFSLDTSRKIVLPIHYDAGDIIVEDGDALEIPFYMESLGSAKPNYPLLDSLHKYTPFDENPCYSVLTTAPSSNSIYRTKKLNLTDSDFNNIKDWLMEYDSSFYKN